MIMNGMQLKEIRREVGQDFLWFQKNIRRWTKAYQKVRKGGFRSSRALRACLPPKYEEVRTPRKNRAFIGTMAIRNKVNYVWFLYADHLDKRSFITVNLPNHDRDRWLLYEALRQGDYSSLWLVSHREHLYHRYQQRTQQCGLSTMDLFQQFMYSRIQRSFAQESKSDKKDQIRLHEYQREGMLAGNKYPKSRQTVYNTFLNPLCMRPHYQAQWARYFPVEASKIDWLMLRCVELNDYKWEEE